MAIQKRTKIVATIGPSSESVGVLSAMMKNGMDVARLNFSHGTHEHHATLIKHIHSAARKVRKTVAILQDLSGPKIRVGELPEEGVKLVRGNEIRFHTQGPFEEGDIPSLPMPYKAFPKVVKRGTKLLLDDGKMEARVLSKGAGWVKARVMVGGTLISHKGVNIPEAAVKIPAITSKDRADLLFGLSHGVDAVAISFVQSADDVKQLRRLITKYEKRYRLRSAADAPVKVFVKIEKPAAVEAFDEILEQADGILVARGDMALEVGYEHVPIIQKDIVAKCVAASKPVIIATQMLDSMTERPHPTRAEVSDVANAVIDHADAVMLSQESAVGAYPAETIKTMSDVILETEGSAYDDVQIARALGGMPVEQKNDEPIVAGVAGLLSLMVHADALLVASLSSAAARLVSQHRPELPIFAVTEDPRVERQLAFSWGVVPVYLHTPSRSVDDLIRRSVETLRRRKLVKKTAKLVVLARQPVGKEGPVNMLQVVN